MFLRNKKSYLTIGAIAIVFLAGILFFDQKDNDAPFAKAAAAQNVRGFAWSENIGWISFNSLNCDPDNDGKSEGVAADGDTDGCPILDSIIPAYGVNLDLGGTNNLSGYAWSENIGWISFQTADVAGCPMAPCQPQLSGSNFSGWARVLANGGGWDGWIRLRNAPNYEVTLNGSSEFEGFAWSDMVVGWLSFNSKNCDTNGNNVIDLGEDINGCPVVTTTVPNYKVYLGNTPPTVSNLTVTHPTPAELCIKPAHYGLSWRFSDPSDIEKQFQIQVDDNIGFNSLQIDICGDNSASIPDGFGGTICTLPGGLSNASPAVNNPPIFLVDPLAAVGTNKLAYGATYYWRVRAWDSLGSSFGWVYYDPNSNGFDAADVFQTANHEYPDVGFAPPPPATFVVNSPITFKTTGNIVNPPYNPATDNSQCYGAGNLPADCKQWEWDFENDSVFDPPIVGVSGETQHAYSNPGSYGVVLRVTDLNNNICSNLGNPELLGAVKPKWKEVIPR